MSTAAKKRAGCCCGGVGCCHCERPLGTHCCFGLGDTAIFRFNMSPVTIHTHACEGDGTTRGTTYGAIDVSASYDWIACSGGYVHWLKKDGQPACLPHWILQPCDMVSEYIYLKEDLTEWTPAECMDGTEFDNIPMLCASILVCDLTPECCRPGGSSDPTVPVHVFNDCCIEVNPNTCAGLKVEWWCHGCSYIGGGEWEPVCVNWFVEFTTTREACEWDEEGQRCRKSAA